MQNTAQLLMIQPVYFGFNAETAVNNAFQKDTGTDVQQLALQEFNAFVGLLRSHKVDVTVVEDSAEPVTPDSIFPNNWISFHSDGRIYLYPMFAANRRQERKSAVLDTIQATFKVREIIDLTSSEAAQLFLEGTGSMVLDRENRIAYACLSPRTNELVLQEFCRIAGFTPLHFRAVDKNKTAIYHTNVMMCLGKTFAVVCLDAIPVEQERIKLLATLAETNKAVIDITLEQLDHFAGNMLQVMNEDGALLLVMSTQAYRSLTEQQVKALEQHNTILQASLHTIETTGGGSARCMMAEVFLERT